MNGALIVLMGAIYWLFLHRVAQMYMGQATLFCLATALFAYWIAIVRGHPKMTAWHVVCFLTGGIVLDGISAFIV